MSAISISRLWRDRRRQQAVCGFPEEEAHLKCAQVINLTVGDSEEEAH